MMNQVSHAVVASTRALVRAVNGQAGLAYADETWSPLPDITMQLIARRMGCVLREAALGPAVQEYGLPAYMGAPVITVNKNLPPATRGLALRHGLAHLVAGELESEPGSEIRFMSSIFDWTTIEERRADLFALADLVPARDVRAATGRFADYDEFEEWLKAEVRQFAPDWTEERVQDRARLLVALHL